MSVVDGDSAAAAALVRADVLVDAPVAAPSAADASVTSSRGKAENDSSFQKLISQSYVDGWKCFGVNL